MGLIKRLADYIMLAGWVMPLALATHFWRKRRRRMRRLKALAGTSQGAIQQNPLRAFRTTLVAAFMFMVGNSAAVWALHPLEGWMGKSCYETAMSSQECTFLSATGVVVLFLTSHSEVY